MADPVAGLPGFRPTSQEDDARRKLDPRKAQDPLTSLPGMSPLPEDEMAGATGPTLEAPGQETLVQDELVQIPGMQVQPAPQQGAPQIQSVEAREPDDLRTALLKSLDSIIPLMQQTVKGLQLGQQETSQGMITPDTLGTYVQGMMEGQDNERIMETVRAQQEKEITRTQREIAILDEELKENAVQGRSLLDPVTLANMALTSGVTDMLPIIGLGLVNPLLGLGYLGVSAYGRQYGDSRVNRGRSIEESMMDATAMSAFEAVPSAVPIGQLFKKGSGFVERVFKTGTSEGAQEVITEALNMGYEQGIFGDDISLKHAMERTVAAGLVGGALGSVAGAAIHPVVAQYEGIQLRSERAGNALNFKPVGENSAQNRPKKILLEPDEALDLNNLDLSPDAYVIGGPDLTVGEQRRAQVVDQKVEALEIAQAQEQDPAKAQGIMAELEPLKMEQADYRERMKRRVNHQGQVVDPTVFGEEAKFNQPKEELYKEHTPDLESEIMLNWNEGVDKDAYVRDAAATNRFLNSDQKILRDEWQGGADPSSMAKFAESVKNNERYQEDIQGLLDKHWPGQDYITVYKGHRDKSPAFDKHGNRKWGNASVDPIIAAQFAASNQLSTDQKTKLEKQINEGVAQPQTLTPEERDAAYRKGQLSIARVPKRAVKGIFTFDQGHEAELVFDMQDPLLKRMGTARPFRADEAGLPEMKEKLGGELYKNLTYLREGNKFSMRKKLPVFHVDDLGQMFLPGMQKTPDVSPEQIDLFGDHTKYFQINAAQQPLDFEGERDPVASSANEAQETLGKRLGEIFSDLGKGADKTKWFNTADRKKFENGLDRYSRWIKQTWTLQQLIRRNPHISGVVRYGEAATAWANSKMRWIARANERVNQWKALGKERADKLSNFLFDLTNNEYPMVDGRTREEMQGTWPTDKEFQALAEKHGLTEMELDLYNEIRSDFTDVLNDLEEILILDARRTLDAGPIREAEILRIKEDMSRMRKAPYFPLSRFGQYTIIVKDANNKIVNVEAYESESSRNTAFNKRKKEFDSTHKVIASKIPDNMSVYQGLPPMFIEKMRGHLKLNEEQQQALDIIAFEYSPSHSFKKHFLRREGTPGYSKDGLRNYANYFLHAGNHLARLRHRPEMEAAIKEVGDSVRDMMNISGMNVTKRVKIMEHLQDHFDYIMNPQNEWEALRSAGFVFYLGFNVKSAVVNLTQIPLVANPYLSARFGDTKAIPALAKAMTDFRTLYGKNSLEALEEGRFTKEQESEIKLIGMGQRQGFLDESQAMELAAMSEGSALQRVLPQSPLGKLWRETTYASAWMFQLAERYNRKSVFLASARLAKATFRGESDKGMQYLKSLQQQHPRLFAWLKENDFSTEEAYAFLAGKDAVDTTQYEYARWNRPNFMRGKRSTIFLFYQYLQNTLWFMGNAPGRGRAILTMLALGGIMALPGADDMADFVQWASRRMFGKHFDPRVELREMLVSLGAENPDWFMHGISHDSFGLSTVSEMVGVPLPSVDMSGSLSMGDVIPGTEALAAPGDFEHKFVRGMTDIGGGVMAMGVGALQAFSDTENPDQFKRWERAMPSAMKGAAKAYRFAQRGEETTRGGGTIAEFDTTDPEQAMEIIAQSMAFTPTRLTRAWNKQRMMKEVEMFYQARRTYLMGSFFHAMRLGDREGIADVKKHIRRYNEDAPHRSLMISVKDLTQSINSRRRAAARTSLGMPQGNRYLPLARDIQALFPDGGVDVAPLQLPQSPQQSIPGAQPPDLPGVIQRTEEDVR